MNTPTLDQLVAFGLAVQSLYERIAGDGPGTEPLRAGDHATRVDRDLETAIVDLTTRAFGDTGVVAEEAVSEGGGIVQPDAPLRVYIDPIDGTHLYNRAVPGFATTVGFELCGRLCAGVMYLPADGRLLIAQRDGSGHGRVTTVRVTGPVATPGRPSPDVVAVKSGLRRAVPRVDSTLAWHGFRVQNLGSVANRMAQTADRAIRGLVKDVQRTNGVSRLWGIAAGLVLCAATDVPMYWDAERRILIVGDPRLASILRSAGIATADERDLDAVWTAMKGPS